MPNLHTEASRVTVLRLQDKAGVIISLLLMRINKQTGQCSVREGGNEGGDTLRSSKRQIHM